MANLTFYILYVQVNFEPNPLVKAYLSTHSHKSLHGLLKSARLVFLLVAFILGVDTKEHVLFIFLCQVL